MRKSIIIVFTLFTFAVTAQNGYETVLKEIETNSITLKALQNQMEAQQLGASQGMYLTNPEIEFGYLFGNPTELGNRLTIEAKQSFDFPSAYSYRKQLYKLGNTHAEISYKAERMNLLLTAKQICAELIYYNALADEYVDRLKNAESIAETYRKKLEKGECNILESNKAELNLTGVRNEVSRIEIEQSRLLSELKKLNGGKDIVFNTAVYPNYALPNNFSSWYSQAESKNPVLHYVKTQLDVAATQVKLSRAESLPKFSVGYISEQATDDHFQGISVGLTIPLWENKNTVKRTKAEARFAEANFDDAKIQFYNHLQNLYTKAENLHTNVNKYKDALSKYGNKQHLKKALDMGEISLLEYLLELEYYYDAVNTLLETEKDLEFCLTELSAVEL